VIDHLRSRKYGTRPPNGKRQAAEIVVKVADAPMKKGWLPGNGRPPHFIMLPARTRRRVIRRWS